MHVDRRLKVLIAISQVFQKMCPFPLNINWDSKNHKIIVKRYPHKTRALFRYYFLHVGSVLVTLILYLIHILGQHHHGTLKDLPVFKLCFTAGHSLILTSVFSFSLAYIKCGEELGWALGQFMSIGKCFLQGNSRQVHLGNYGDNNGATSHAIKTKPWIKPKDGLSLFFIIIVLQNVHNAIIAINFFLQKNLDPLYSALATFNFPPNILNHQAFLLIRLLFLIISTFEVTRASALTICIVLLLCITMHDVSETFLEDLHKFKDSTSIKTYHFTFVLLKFTKFQLISNWIQAVTSDLFLIMQTTGTILFIMFNYNSIRLYGAMPFQIYIGIPVTSVASIGVICIYLKWVTGIHDMTTKFVKTVRSGFLPRQYAYKLASSKSSLGLRVGIFFVLKKSTKAKIIDGLIINTINTLLTF